MYFATASNKKYVSYAFGAKFQVPVARQGGRVMSAPRPRVTEPFHPLSSINNWQQLLYIYTPVFQFFPPCGLSVSCCGAYLTTAHALFQKLSLLWFRPSFRPSTDLILIHMVRASDLAYWGRPSPATLKRVAAVHQFPVSCSRFPVPQFPYK